MATDKHKGQTDSIGLDCAVFYVAANTVQVIWETVFTGQKTQPTVLKYCSTRTNQTYNKQTLTENSLVYNNMG